MKKALQALESIRKTIQQLDYGFISKEDCEDFQIIETTIKNQKRKLDLIGEILVDVSKGNYANLNDAINEIREVLEDE